MKTILFPILGCFLMLYGVSAQTQFKRHEPNWSRAAALEAASHAGSRQALTRLFELAREGRSADVLQEMEAVEAEADWPLPAREYVLHAFAVGLGDLPSWQDSNRVIDHLMAYSIGTWVPGEHYPGHGVPLFNIRAAASGTAMEWRRQAAWIEAQTMFQKGGEAWIDAYLLAGLPERRGYAEALKSADKSTLQEIGSASLAALDREPALSSLAARAGLQLGDPVLLSQAVARGDSDGMAEVLREASKAFDENEAESILRYAVENAKPEMAALVMAVFAPKLIKYPDISALMISTLESRELGVAAALVLSRSSDPSIQLQLTELANRSQGLASRRAAMALSDEAFTAGEER